MSRMQTIIEKAEREGTLRHIVHTNPDPAAAAALPVNGTPVVLAAEVAAPAVPAASPARTVATTHIHPSVAAAVQVGGSVAEQYRALRTRILHSDNNGAPVRVLLVTSPGRGEGKSLTVANLGLAMAQEYNQRICIVDAHLRSPEMHRLFGLPAGPGLTDVLSGRAEIEEALITIEDRNITVLQAGTPPPQPAEMLGAAAMRRTIETLRSKFDRVLVDAPAVMPLADVGVLTPLVDSIALVVRSGMTSKPSIHEAVGTLDHTKLRGIVLNDAA